jgi:DNA-binding response OmpR family regulator
MIADDDADFLEGAKVFFASRDIEVNTAQTPEEAEKILIETKEKGENEFDVLATDVNFGDMSETKGNEFVRDSQHLMGNAKPVLFSGEISEEERRQLEDNGFPVLPKKEDLTQRLAEIVQEANKKRTDEIEEVFEEVLRNETAPRIKELTGRDVEIVKLYTHAPPLPVDEAVYNRLKRTLIEWLKTRREPDEPVLVYGKHVYSPNEMALEVESETQVGVKHVQMLINVFVNSLGMKLDDDFDEDDDEDSQGTVENVSPFDNDDAKQTFREE